MEPPPGKGVVMKALAFEGPGRRIWHEVPDPVIWC